MTKYIDYKATIWFRIPVSDIEDFSIIKEKLEAGELPSELYNNDDFQLGQCDPLYDTEEFISPNENDGQATIEVYEYNKVDNCVQCEVIWDNSYESELKRKETKT